MKPGKQQSFPIIDNGSRGTADCFQGHMSTITMMPCGEMGLQGDSCEQDGDVWIWNLYR